MTKKKVIITTLILLLILTGIRILWYVSFKPSEHPHSIQGQLDLRGWDFSTNYPITLDGEWEFYPNVFIMQEPDYEPSQSEKQGFINVPESWNTHLTSLNDSAYGFGSYRLRILIDSEENQKFGMRVPNIAHSSALYVNGQLIATTGQTASSKKEYKAKNIPYTAFFETNNDELEIVIQVANFDDPHVGGIISSIKFGSDRSINHYQLLSVSMQLLLCVVLLIHLIYCGILFLIGIRERPLIFFALAIFCAIFMILVDDDKLLFVWVPISLEWAHKIRIIFYLGASAFLFQYFRYLVPKYKEAKVIKWHSIFVACYVVLVLLGFMNHNVLFNNLFFLIYLPPFLIIPILQIRSAVGGNREAIFHVFGATSITTNVLWGFSIQFGWIDMVYYPFDLLICFFAFASFWFQRFLHTSAQTEKLAIKLQKIDKLKDEFLANTSLELRNPLHGMLNITQTILEDNHHSLNEKNIENLNLIRTIGRQMIFLINNLVDFSQIKENKIELQLSNVRIQAIAFGVFDLLRYMTDGKPIKLIMDIPDDFPPVHADEKRLIQIIFNLVHNSIKFTQKGTIRIHAEIRDQNAHIYISDTGIGMDNSTRQKIFHAFELGDSSMTEMGEGLGLGLSISQQLVHLHGGSLSVRSTLGKGSVFIFNLPLSVNEDYREEYQVIQSMFAEQAVALSADENSRRIDIKSSRVINRTRIMVIDDDVLNLKILSNILSDHDYEIVTFTSSREALDQLDKADWDLIITDGMMPQMSGYELTRLIRERFSISELPILLLTARNRPEDLYAGFLSGANDYVTKPVDALELKARVRALTDLKRSVGERLRMEGAYLQAQIQPHFLFNTLNSIIALSNIDISKMQDLIDAFSTYLRISFTSWNAEKLVPIQQELELVHAYLYIEQERFRDRLKITWDVDQNLELLIPPITIQPLVENAVRHGILSRAQGGNLSIKISDHIKYTEIIIADDGVGMSRGKVESLLKGEIGINKGIGIPNTEKRLKQMYGRGLTIESRPEHGTTISFRIPKK